MWEVQDKSKRQDLTPYCSIAGCFIYNYLRATRHIAILNRECIPCWMVGSFADIRCTIQYLVNLTRCHH